MAVGGLVTSAWVLPALPASLLISYYHSIELVR